MKNRSNDDDRQKKKLDKISYHDKLRRNLNLDNDQDSHVYLEITGEYRLKVYSEERLGTIMRALRVTRNLSQRELADRAKINQTYLCKIEGGHTNVSVAILSDLCEALELRLSELFFVLEQSSEIRDMLSRFDFSNKNDLYYVLYSTIVKQKRRR